MQASPAKYNLALPTPAKYDLARPTPAKCNLARPRRLRCFLCGGREGCAARGTAPKHNPVKHYGISPARTILMRCYC